MKQSIFLISSIIFFACNFNAREMKADNNNQRPLQHSDTSLRQCILEKDTLLDDDNFIKYIIIDTFYTLKIQVGGLDTLLPYRFTCSVPRGLVPSFYSFYRNTICLIRGTGQHYREFTICYNENNHIVINKYETALATSLEKGIVVYQNYDSLQLINVENIRTKEKRTFTIPAKFLSSNISQTIIKSNKLLLKFTDNKEVEFLLR